MFYFISSQIDHLGVDVYVDVGCGGGVVPEGERAVAVEDGRDGQVVVQDPRDVGGRAETTHDPPVKVIEWRIFNKDDLDELSILPFLEGIKIILDTTRLRWRTLMDSDMEENSSLTRVFYTNHSWIIE